MGKLETLTYERDGRIARITLDRPERGNGITLEMPRRARRRVERGQPRPRGPRDRPRRQRQRLLRRLRPRLRRELRRRFRRRARAAAPATRRRSPPTTTPSGPGTRSLDFQMMSRNLRGFMSLFHSEKPVVCKVHGFCVAGGTDMALCSDLIVVEDRAKIGYPPARVWGVPTIDALGAADRARARPSGCCSPATRSTGTTAVEWGLATEAAPLAELDEALRGAARAGRAAAGQPARHAQARDQPPLSPRASTATRR